MAACCWEKGFIGSVYPGLPPPWVMPQNAWCDFSTTGVQQYFSGIPPYIAGNMNIAAWRTFSDTITQYILDTPLPPHHWGLGDVAQYGFSESISQAGGLAPVIFLSVPDYYMNFHPDALPYLKKFHLSTALDYTAKDLGQSIPAQIHASNPFYTRWKQWQQNEAPANVPVAELPKGTLHNDDIDIILEFVHFDNLEMAGGMVSHRFASLSRFMSRMWCEFRNNIPRVDPDISGLVTPVIALPRGEYIAAKATAGGFDYARAAYTARPHSSVSDSSIIDAYNRLYPLRDEDATISMAVNNVRLQLPDEMEWNDYRVGELLRDLLYFEPVQSYSSPDNFQDFGGSNGST